MTPLNRALRNTARIGKVADRRHCFARLSLGSNGDSDGRFVGGAGPRRPTEAMELRRAAEVQKCADKGWKSAMICLGNMRKGGVSPGTAAYNVALRACVGAGEWYRAAALVEVMKGSGATLDAALAREIDSGLTTAAGGAGGDAVAMGFEKDADLACDAVSPGSGAGGISSGSGSGSGSGRGSRLGYVAGMHTTAVYADADWPRGGGGIISSTDSNNNIGSSSSANSSSSSSGSTGSGRGVAGGLSSLRSMAWDEGPWRNHSKQQQQQQRQHGHYLAGGRGNLHAAERGGKNKGAWPSAAPAPLAECWGDD